MAVLLVIVAVLVVAALWVERRRRDRGTALHPNEPRNSWGGGPGINGTTGGGGMG